MKTLEDAVWIYFGYPNPNWTRKCRSCLEEVRLTRTAGREALTCWHLEIWEHGPLATRTVRQYAGFDEAVRDLLTLLRRSAAFSCAKISKGPVAVVNTGEPSRGYPALPVDRVLIVYARYAGERDELLSAIAGWAGHAPGDCPVPVRRGCWRMEDYLGDWRAWSSEAN